MYRAKTEGEDRQVYPDFQPQCALETGKAGHLMCLLATKRKMKRENKDRGLCVW